MSEPKETPAAVAEVLNFLRGGQQSLYEMVQVYDRTLAPEDHWWLGVCLAAMVLADLSEMSHVTKQVELLSDRIAARGARPDVVEQLVDELAKIDSLGLLWPVYERDQGQWRRSETAIARGFGPEEAYWVAVGHLGVALMVREGRQDQVPQVGSAVATMITAGIRPEAVEAILGAFEGSTGASAGEEQTSD